MDTNSTFPGEVHVFMSNEEGDDTEELIQMMYWNPRPWCDRCIAFRHCTWYCKREKNGGDEGGKETCNEVIGGDR